MHIYARTPTGPRPTPMYNACGGRKASCDARWSRHGMVFTP